MHSIAVVKHEYKICLKICLVDFRSSVSITLLHFKNLDLPCFFKQLILSILYQCIIEEAW